MLKLKSCKCVQDQTIFQCSLGLSRLGQTSSLHFVITYFTCCQFNFQDLKTPALCFCYRICLKCFTTYAGENSELQEETLLSPPTSSLSLTGFFSSACLAQFTPSLSPNTLFYKSTEPCTSCEGILDVLSHAKAK